MKSGTVNYPFFFKVTHEIHGRNTRNCDQLQIPLYTSAAGQRSFKFRGAKIWNSLDTDLKEHKSLKNFKLALKSRLFSNLYK